MEKPHTGAHRAKHWVVSCALLSVGWDIFDAQFFGFLAYFLCIHSAFQLRELLFVILVYSLLDWQDVIAKAAVALTTILRDDLRMLGLDQTVFLQFANIFRYGVDGETELVRNFGIASETLKSFPVFDAKQIRIDDEFVCVQMQIENNIGRYEIVSLQLLPGVLRFH